MKVCQLSTFDNYGGAARAAFRLHQGLRALNVDSLMLVDKKSSADDSVVVTTKSRKTFSGLARYYSREIDALPLKLYKNWSKQTTWSLNYLSNGMAQQVKALAPDIVHLHWVGNGFVPIQALGQINQPLIWTLHDMWAFTGGCHFSDDCNRYQAHCGDCPQLASGRDNDLSRWIWNKKRESWSNVNLTIVTPSRWLAEQARSSSLFADRRIEVIPNGLDLQFYHPVDKLRARRLLNLPTDKNLILFGAANSTGDTRKGFHLLQSAVRYLSSDWAKSAELVVFGASASPNMGLKSHYLGYVNHDALLSLMYAAADVFVAPSMQDNLPNTIMEAMACGTPVVGFKIGGIPDLIDHQQNGYLAEPFEIDDLANGIAWVLEDEERRSALAAQARQKAEREFELSLIAKCYQNLYQELIDQRRLKTEN